MLKKYTKFYYIFYVIAFILLFAISISSSFAINNSKSSNPSIDHDKKYKVGVIVRKPYGFESNNVYSGISVDIWKSVADQNKIEYEFVPIYKHGIGALNNLTDNKIDVLIGDISVISSYLKKFDFSRPYYIDRLSIVGVHKKENLEDVFLRIFASIFTSYIFYVLIFLVVIILLVCVLEYRKKNKIYKGQPFLKGLFLSFYATMVCFWGNNEMPYIRSNLSRVLCVVCLFASIFVVSIIVGVVTASVTISSSNLSMSGSQESLSTLYSKPVVVVKDSYAASAAKKLGATILEADDIKDAFKIVNDNPSFKVMGGYLTIKYFLMDNPEYKLNNKAIAAGANEIAFAFRKSSPLLLPINLTLTSMQEDNKIYQICKGTLSVADSLDCQI